MKITKEQEYINSDDIVNSNPSIDIIRLARKDLILAKTLAEFFGTLNIHKGKVVYSEAKRKELNLSLNASEMEDLYDMLSWCYSKYEGNLLIVMCLKRLCGIFIRRLIDSFDEPKLVKTLDSNYGSLERFINVNTNEDFNKFIDEINNTSNLQLIINYYVFRHWEQETRAKNGLEPLYIKSSGYNTYEISRNVRIEF